MADIGDEDGKYEDIRQKGRTRYYELAKPKLPKSDWWTCIYPDVMWGTQDMLFPIPNSALSANASERVTTLATPKKNFQKGTVYEHKPLFLYSCGRPSQIWQVSPGAKQGAASTRVEELAQPKAFHPEHKPNRPHFQFSCGRESAIWLVSPGARECRERPRTTALAEARPPHREFLGARSIETVIPQNALNGKIHDPDYLNVLALPKKRQEVQFRESQWEVSQTARKAAATPRLVELARPKGLVEGYQLPRGEMSDVSKAARRAVCSNRVSELSKPIERASMDHLQFNPDAFLVKPNALKGVFPSHVNDLAQPIQR